MNTYLTGNTIKKLREANGMTQSELASLLSVSDKAVSKWETGKGYPDISLIEEIAKVLGVSVSEIISGQTVSNANRSGNIKKGGFYVCPVCGNVIFSVGRAVICCHGINLSPLEFNEKRDGHEIVLTETEDEYYVTVEHEMSKSHYISFIASVCDNTVNIVKLYPESDCSAYFKRSRTEEIYYYCTRDGLFKYSKNGDKKMKNEAKKRWGNTDAYKEFEEKQKDRTEEDEKVIADGVMKIFAEFGKIKNLSPESEEAQNTVLKLKNHISENYYDCTDTILKSLGEMYINDERFKKNIDNAGGDGTAEFVHKAINCR